MIKHSIELKSLLPKGNVVCECRDHLLYMKTNRSIPTSRFDVEHLSINSYAYLPNQYKVPFRIDMTVKMDAPGLYILIGKGHVNIGTCWSDNRRIDDIVNPARKTAFFHNHINMNEFTEVSLLYDYKEMQILINGEERYYSKKERYMKSLVFREMNEEGLELKIACDKQVKLCLKDLSVTEYEETCGILHTEELPTAIMKNEAIALGEKPTFDKCISLLPEQLQQEILKTDAYLKSLKSLKFKRQIEKHGNKITYVSSDYGFSYAIYLSNDILDHSLQWYLITSGKPETWHRKDDRMEEMLNRYDNVSKDFAERMFYNLEDCVGCYNNCLAKTLYRYHEKQKAVCHGKLKFDMSISGFEDVRAFIEELNHLVQEPVHMAISNEFDSEYCNVRYIAKDNIVLLTWKKFCCYEEYRKPTTFALEILKKYPNSNFVVDARNGFEDVKEDVEWGFSVLLPAMSQTDCKSVTFILNEVNEIEEEMDMWTKEFMKYFTVKKVESYKEVQCETVKRY